MKSDFLLAITQLSAEKNLSKEVVIAAVEAALISAYRKDNFADKQKVAVRINPNTGKVEVWAEKTVVAVKKDPTSGKIEVSSEGTGAETPEDAHREIDIRREISLEDALILKPGVKVGETVEVEVTPHNAGRIAAQTAKQVILQRLHEAEHSAIFEEYAGKEGDTITGVIQRIEPKQIFVDLGRTEAVMPGSEQVPNERYRIGQRLKFYLVEVVKTPKGPKVVLSRSHPSLLRRLFELEVPEVFSGAVEIKSIAREAGYRSKVAVAARQEGIDPVGCCVGLRGIRIQNVVSELNGEKIDVVMWDAQSARFIANALSPAQVVGVELNNAEKLATVIIPDKQLSLAIGKEGQNVRLAAKLTEWRIDIKNASIVEAARALEAKEAAEKAAVEKAAQAEASPVAAVEPVTEAPIASRPASEGVPAGQAAAPAAPAGEAVLIVPFIPKKTEGKGELRFAEDILPYKPPKPGVKSKKSKKKVVGKTAEDGIKLKKQRRVGGIPVVEEEDEF